MHTNSACRFPILALLTAFAMSVMPLSCGQRTEVRLAPGRNAMVQVGTDVLYEEDVLKVLPLGLSENDSMEFVHRYIDNWIQDVLFYEKAKRNVPDTREIDQLVENYRRSLFEHEYQRSLVRQKLQSEISLQQIDSFYTANQDLFELDHTVVKGLFLIVPSKSRDLDRFRELCGCADDDCFEEMEKLSIRNAARCEFFYDSWRSAQEILMMIPVGSGIGESEIEAGGRYEFADGDNVYLLNVSEIVPKGGVEPLENVSGRIRGLLTNRNEVEYVRSIKEKLYSQALEDNSIIFFNRESK